MDRARILSSRILVGFAGAAAVALWFLLYDLAAGIPFRDHRVSFGELLTSGE